MSRSKSMVAVGLEVAPGALIQTFGIGHLYQGRYKAGLGIMLSYWILQAINTALMSVWIGFVTAPLTWLAYMIFAPTNVLDSRKR